MLRIFSGVAAIAAGVSFVALAAASPASQPVRTISQIDGKPILLKRMVVTATAVPN